MRTKQTNSQSYRSSFENKDRCERCGEELCEVGVIGVVGNLFKGMYDKNVGGLVFNSNTKFPPEIYELRCGACDYDLRGPIYYNWEFRDNI